jgi:hypothetical protein
MEKYHISSLDHPLLAPRYSPYAPPTPLSPPESYFQHSVGTQVFRKPVPIVRTSAVPSVIRSTITTTKSLIHKLWIIEVFAACVSVLTLGILFVVLHAFDKRKVANKGFFSGLPTTLVNALSSIMRTSMLLPVVTALAQLQWSWFKEERPLVDFETFDDATRGVLGSILFLTKMTRRRFW